MTLLQKLMAQYPAWCWGRRCSHPFQQAMKQSRCRHIGRNRCSLDGKVYEVCKRCLFIAGD